MTNVLEMQSLQVEEEQSTLVAEGYPGTTWRPW